ncbi:MAG: pyridoxal 5'-phosphate synthase glutaminase subunit PdxT [Gammaproteobacteria bacterium]|nr:pyridoxal 5'-phosphate synthase glutaminase subunit PdxT [Gammaproteobacteria bacterium]
MKIGLLALQGDYEKHSQILTQLDMQSVLIRYPKQLDDVSGLIIPGGESTTMSKLIDATHFRRPLKAFAQDYPILGTCAGLIMMSYLEQLDSRVKPLNIIAVSVGRNAYGRQQNSFVDQLTVNVDDQQKSITATFIRAPQITTLGPDVEVLARHNTMPVAVRQGHHIGLTFHPELNDVGLFHQLAFGGV